MGCQKKRHGFFNTRTEKNFLRGEQKKEALLVRKSGMDFQQANKKAAWAVRKSGMGFLTGEQRTEKSFLTGEQKKAF